MKRYFFDIVGDNGFFSQDAGGALFRSLEEVREEAEQFAVDMRAHAAVTGDRCQERIEVTNENGNLILRMDCAALEDALA